MRLATFTHRGATRIGVVRDDQVVDVCAAADRLPATMRALLAAGPPALDAVARALEAAPRISLAEVRLWAPVPRPREFLAVGINYLDHIAETGQDRPDFPKIFNKQVTCVAGPYDDVHLPRVSTKLDYEGELAFVIGRRCRHVPRERAHEVIAGYVACVDFSVRDWQRRAPTLTLGKSFDTHGPFGPWLVTPDELGDPHELGVRTWVNGELRQDSNTRHLLFDCYALVETLSTVMTLWPGTVIATGTPAGVGAAMNPPRFLKVGDVVRVEVERIGHLEHRIVPEPAGTARLG